MFIQTKPTSASYQSCVPRFEHYQHNMTGFDYCDKFQNEVFNNDLAETVTISYNIDSRDLESVNIEATGVEQSKAGLLNAIVNKWFKGVS